MRPEGFTEPPPGAALARYERQRLDWKACGHGLSRGTMLAPLDYANPDGTAITLAVAKRPATSSKRLGSLIINPGGPGGSGGYVGYFNAEGLEDYDIVGWDPRGVGRSTPVACYGAADLDRYSRWTARPMIQRNCKPDRRTDQVRPILPVSLGLLLEHVSTMETVRDLDLLRHLVGDSKINYFGSSYGTRIGAIYAELFPQGWPDGSRWCCQCQFQVHQSSGWLRAGTPSFRGVVRGWMSPWRSAR